MKYRKKPVVVEAFQLKDNLYFKFFGCVYHLYQNEGLFPRWIIKRIDRFFIKNKEYLQHNGKLMVKTLEGEHIISKNDWIIKGVKGELYPCKPDIFEMTYEKVEGK